ncbi:hypothetical protein BO78DRAFT_134253 [Aspergillus sclerotiicarbonarius CBS 121057]|uniref:Uncharacterized protein n=1 Tax=Aspergillus sclerotiicarbonarius (strain CBS 121057 / IBT 28362) TaxID=1448318 RepID=A0A319EMF3_ASPSB|nr:hypothetical protein BO78DRAFT_134253 [Aspergillus sclerotiicarbonarius CBS 121057]
MAIHYITYRPLLPPYLTGPSSPPASVVSPPSHPPHPIPTLSLEFSSQNSTLQCNLTCVTPRVLSSSDGSHVLPLAGHSMIRYLR